MTALLLLAAAYGALRWGGDGRGAVVTALALAAVAGTTLPDLDQVLPLGGRRSGLSHSLRAALLCLGRSLRPLAAGLAFGLALHLSADIFPRAMRGYATVKLPGFGSLGRQGSWVWLAANMVGGFALAAMLARAQLRDPAALIALAVLGTIAALLYLVAVPGGWWAILLLAAAAWGGWRWTRTGRAAR